MTKFRIVEQQRADNTKQFFIEWKDGSRWRDLPEFEINGECVTDEDDESFSTLGAAQAFVDNIRQEELRLTVVKTIYHEA